MVVFIIVRLLVEVLYWNVVRLSGDSELAAFWSWLSLLYLLTVFTLVALFTLSFRGSGGLPL